MKKTILLLNVALAFMGVGQVWQVQLSSYPLWAYVGPNEIRDYHIAWWHSIWIPLFVPAGLAMLSTFFMLWVRPKSLNRSSVWVAIVLLVLTYTLTFLWWAPLMALIGATPTETAAVSNWAPLVAKFGLQSKTQDQLYHLLLSTHWLRVALLSAYGIAILRMALVCFQFKKPNIAAPLAMMSIE